MADSDRQRKGDQSTESKRRLLYAVRQLPDGKIGLYPAHGHGSLPALKAGGCVCDRVGALHCPAADLKEMLANQQAQRQQMQRQPYPYAA